VTAPEEQLPTPLEVDVSTEGTFLFSFVAEPETLGIFIPAETVYPVGTPLHLRFAPPPDAHPRALEPFEVVGSVVWVSSPESGRFVPGMGVRFGELEDARRALLVELVTAVTYFS